MNTNFAPPPNAFFQVCLGDARLKIRTIWFLNHQGDSPLAVTHGSYFSIFFNLEFTPGFGLVFGAQVIEHHLIQPSRPMQNGLVASLNGKIRDEFLNECWFLNLYDAKDQSEEFKQQYNTDREHSSL